MTRTKNVKNNMLVSIGTPTYNRANSYLRYALESAINQTYKNIEIIVSDNGSTDNTEELVLSYYDDRIRYIKQKEPLHPIDNFNYCVQMAKGNYFLMLHDDDVIDPDFVETCINASDGRTDFGMIRTGMRRIDHYGNVINERPNYASGLDVKDFYKAWMEGGNTPMHLCCTLFNTKGLREVGGFQSKKHLFADVVPEVYLAAKYERLDIEAVKASFRKHASHLAGKGKIRDWCEDSHYLLNIMMNLAGNHDESFRNLGLKFFTGHCYGYAKTVKPFKERVSAYYIIYKSFDYSSSFFLNKWVMQPTTSFIKRVARKLTPKNQHISD